MPKVDGENYEAQLLEKMDAVVTSVEKKLGEGQKTYEDMQGTIKSLEETLVDVKAKYTELEESMSQRAWLRAALRPISFAVSSRIAQ